MIRFASLFTILGLGLAPVQSWAQDRAWQGDRNERIERRASREIPLPSLIRMLEQRTGGRYVSANPTEGPDGQPAYWIRLQLGGGRIVDFVVDAASGRVLSGG